MIKNQLCDNVFINKFLFFYICIFLFFPDQYVNAETDLNNSCYNYLTELVRRSDFDFRGVNPAKVNLLIDTVNSEYILAKLISDKEESDVSNDMNSSITIGWVKYNLNSRKLYDVSGYNDPDDQVEIQHDKKYAFGFDNCLKVRSRNK